MQAETPAPGQREAQRIAESGSSGTWATLGPLPEDSCPSTSPEARAQAPLARPPPAPAPGAQLLWRAAPAPGEGSLRPAGGLLGCLGDTSAAVLLCARLGAGPVSHLLPTLLILPAWASVLLAGSSRALGLCVLGWGGHGPHLSPWRWRWTEQGRCGFVLGECAGLLQGSQHRPCVHLRCLGSPPGVVPDEPSPNEVATETRAFTSSWGQACGVSEDPPQEHCDRHGTRGGRQGLLLCGSGLTPAWQGMSHVLVPRMGTAD